MPQTIKIIISGVTGRIGRRVLKMVLQNPQFELIAGLVSPTSADLGKDLGFLLDGDMTGKAVGVRAIESLADVKADVVIDFALADGFDELVDYCVLTNTALVSGTTGINQASFDRIGQAAKYIPLLWTSNFSLNVQIFKNLLQILKQTNPKGVFKITETHHIHKKDMPSGTAISLAQAIEPSSKMTKLNDNTFKLGQVNIAAFREGEVPGTHEVICQLDNETITLKHESHDPGIFAEGAINAATWIIGKPAGFYDLNAVLMG